MKNFRIYEFFPILFLFKSFLKKVKVYVDKKNYMKKGQFLTIFENSISRVNQSNANTKLAFASQLLKANG